MIYYKATALFMKEITPIEINNEYSHVIPDPEMIFQRFADSDLGRNLNKETRFHFFQPVAVSNKSWVDAAGADTNNLLHMLETYNLTKAFLSENDSFSEKEKRLLEFSAIVHDMAEAVTGDIPRPIKTNEDEQEEMVILSGILNHFLEPEMVETDRHDLIGDVIDVLVEKESKLGKAFNAIENLGYNMTALNSWRTYRMLEYKDSEKELRDGLRKLSHEVMIGDIPKLIDYSREYPFIRNYLLNNEDYIIDILNDAGYEAKCDEDKYERARINLLAFNSSFVA